MVMAGKQKGMYVGNFIFAVVIKAHRLVSLKNGAVPLIIL